MWPQEEKRTRLGRKFIILTGPRKDQRMEVEVENKWRAWATAFMARLGRVNS